MILFSKLYCFFASLHRSLYTGGFKKSIKLKKPVVSVGNITFGGTGKTPFVLKLVEDLQTLGLKPAIVSRSYKGQANESSLIDSEKSRQPHIWGDEACWYFNKVSVPVYSGPKKWQSALLAEKNPAIDVVILDDGFQHYQLQKDINIVLVDAVAGIKDLRTRARESISTLKFADALVITRSNLVSADRLEKFKNVLPQSKPFFLNVTSVEKLRNIKGQAVALHGRKVGLVSGIANPESFKSLFQQSFPEVQEIVCLNFSDHHAYQQEDLKKIENFRVENKLDFVVMTEKDEIKLRDLIFKDSGTNFDHFMVLQIESKFEDPESWMTHLRGLVQ